MIVALIAAAWCVTGILTVPWIIGWQNRHGDAMIREPAIEMFCGLFLGPIPILMFAGYFVLRTVGRAVYRITGQTENAA